MFYIIIIIYIKIIQLVNLKKYCKYVPSLIVVYDQKAEVPCLLHPHIK